MACEVFKPGRIKKVGVFQLDDCLSPIYGPGAGYLDDCPAAFTSSDNIREGADFTPVCADDSVYFHSPGEDSLLGVQVNLDLHNLDPAFAHDLGLSRAILDNDGLPVGSADLTNGGANLLIVVWQTLYGPSCGEGEGCPWFVRAYAVPHARVTEEGDIGTAGAFVRITGESVAVSIGSGPVPLLCDTATGAAEFPLVCFPKSARLKFRGGPPPTGCGVIDLEAPVLACEEESGA
jgi:hypothetical protein